MPLLIKADLKTHIYAEILEQISRNDDDLINRAILAGEAEVIAYLNRYDTASMFVTSYADNLLRRIVSDVVCWRIICLANPNISIELFRTLYEDAIKTLEKIQKGSIQPSWPLRLDDPDTALNERGVLQFHSNKRRAY
jgi:phage gp36-like protein